MGQGPGAVALASVVAMAAVAVAGAATAVAGPGPGAPEPDPAAVAPPAAAPGPVAAAPLAADVAPADPGVGEPAPAVACNQFTAALGQIPASHRANWSLWLDHFDAAWACYTQAIPAATALRPSRNMA